MALGANLPFAGEPPEATLAAALRALVSERLEIVATSRFYRTPCFPAEAGPDYVNSVAILRPAHESDVGTVLETLHRTETVFGRRREGRWGMRTLDLDLLAFGDSILPDGAEQTRWRTLPPERQADATPGGLILPHPRMQDRAFVLVPLAEVAPDWRHPVTGLTVSAMLAALPAADVAAVVPMERGGGQ